MRSPQRSRAQAIAISPWCPRDRMSYPSSAEALLSSAALPPSSSLSIHLDLVGGLSGDMFVAAMVDALPALMPMVLGEVEKVRGADERAAIFTEASSGGLRARRFGLVMEGHAVPTRANAGGRPTSHGHDHGQPH